MEQWRITRSIRYFLSWVFFSLVATAGHAAFEASWQTDVPLATGATAAAVFGQYRLATMDSSDGSFERKDLLPWDRPFAGTWHPAAARASDWMSVTGTFPLVLGVLAWSNDDISGGDFATEALMLYEVLALQSGVNLMVRSLRVWPRPFMLGEKGGSERSEGQAAGSFYSGHASAAFSIAVFSGVWFDETHPGSSWSPWVWSGGLGLAALTAGLRVAAGKHYPTDIVVGAAMGSLIGWAVPALHRTSASPDRRKSMDNTSKLQPSGWLRWHGLEVAPNYLGWQCGF